MIKFNTEYKNLEDVACDVLAIGVFEGAVLADPRLKKLDKDSDRFLSRIVAAENFNGQAKQLLAAHLPGSLLSKKIVLFGLGPKKNYTLKQLIVALNALCMNWENKKIKSVAVLLPPALPAKTNLVDAVQTVVETVVLSTYKFLHYKNFKTGEKPVPLNNVTVLLSRSGDHKLAQKALEQAEVVAEAVCYTRDLGNYPGNVMTPEKLAMMAVELAKELKLKYRVLEKEDMKKLGMGALLGVNQGSALPPKFVVIEYKGGAKTQAPIVLAGKGITFDSGGISIKPSQKMEEMKYDMAGAAAVLGIVRAAAKLHLKSNLVGLVPATENLPSGSAIKPGDVVESMSGKYIEVVNTDAEGRMILADTLAYANKYKPRLVIDYATLTGAMVVALGTELTGAFSNSDRMMKKLKTASDKSGEKIWPMPLEESYKDQIKSNVADIQNVGGATGGGAITAALFLQEFVNYPWIHLDIAGTAWTTEPKPARPRGATGVGVKLTIELLRLL